MRLARIVLLLISGQNRIWLQLKVGRQLRIRSPGTWHCSPRIVVRRKVDSWLMRLLNFNLGLILRQIWQLRRRIARCMRNDHPRLRWLISRVITWKMDFWAFMVPIRWSLILLLLRQLHLQLVQCPGVDLVRLL